MAYALGQCMSCPFEGRRQVPFVGPKDSKFAIVGEYPGKTEIEKKLPFVGRAGQLLDDLLGAIGIDRTTVRMGNAILCGPVTEADRNQKWFPEVVERCATRCAADGDLGAATSISALGTTAAYGLLGKTVALGGSNPSRGALHWTQDKRAVFPAWNPAAILRAGGAEASKSSKLSDADVEVLLIDIQRAWMFAKGDLKEWKPLIRIMADPAQFAAWCRTLPERVAIDVETDSADPVTAKLLVVGMARRLDNVVSPLTESNVVSSLRPADAIESISFWWPNATEDAKEAFRDLLANGIITKTFHNGAYDELVLRHHVGPVLGGVSDTLLLSHARFPECPVGLAAVAQTWLVVPPWKRNHDAWETDRKRRRELARGKGYEVADWTEDRILNLMEYNAYDVGATLAVEPMLVEECEREETLLAAAIDVVQAREAARMTEYGLLVDLKVKAELAEEAKRRHTDAVERMRMLVDTGLKNPADLKAAEELSRLIRDDGGFNFNSQKMLPLAFDVCGVKVPVDRNALTATGKRSFNKDTLGAISDQPLVSALHACRGTARQISVYFGEGSLPLGPDGRLHMPWRIFGTPTGRWSSGGDDEDHDDVVSVNLQNWANFLRRMVVAGPGNILCAADFAQLEYRVIALLAGEQSLLDLFNDPKRPDLHSTNAHRLFGYRWEVCDPLKAIQDEEIVRRTTQRKVLRGLTKSGLYGAMYLGTAKKIRQRLQAGALRESDEKLAEALRRIDEPQCQEFVDAIPRLWPRIDAWRDEKIREVQETHRIRMPITGRHRIWPLGFVEPTQCVNSNVQGPAGDIMSCAFVRLTTALPPEARIILQVHDSVVVECPKEMANLVLKIMVDTMTTRLTIGEFSCDFTVDAKIGPSWDVV
jgi:uracil-DNA glycosylase family 4